MTHSIKQAIESFDNTNFYLSSLRFFQALGYDSDKKIELPQPTLRALCDQFDIDENKIHAEKAKLSDWQEIQFLFQLSNDELAGKEQISIFSSKNVDISDSFLKSYLFVAIGLTGNSYSKTDLVHITRQLNKLFLQPVLILFHYGDLLCLSVIDRRMNKNEGDKDVLEKVTLIKDIRICQPHRAHIEILHDMALPNLNVQNFDQLHKAFRRVLDTSVLNKKFYKELSNWYFWASPQVKFPILENESQENSNSIALIRMITRIIFIWFMKERELIPNKLFKLDFIKSILDFDDKNESTFYKAILQNLFFATLNQDSEQRDFRKEKQNFNATTLYRYEKYFTLNKEEALSLFKDIPFLNGGLFDCLDKPHPTNKGKQGGDEIIRIDGFSDREDSLLKVPDSIFFQEKEKTVDLNEIYGTKNKKYKTRGLLDILKSYKFTVEENTPIEEEIALDPELLGQVFENLLASYNPDTQTTARKSTGSYYTPRQIVDYMVNESLKTSLAHLVSQNLEEVTIDDMKTGLEILFAYTEKEHAFNEREVTEIVKVISELKILDPACGSGAFPMGILHKLVFILNKLDKENTIWRKLQEERALRETEEAYKVGDKEERHTRLTEIEEAFNNNTSDYGRKLFLIENCIFGVDIQPIATQISKLRFFISLLVDEKIDKTRPNWNIRPMPNLETKFVAANSLIGIEKTLKKDQFLLYNIELKNKEEELKKIRHKYFSAKTQQTKKKYRDEDKRIRDEIKQLLIDDEWDIQTAEKLADWDPYDQNSHADFFDKEWMFGNDGFDIVIANPPYVRQEKIRNLKPLLQAQNYQVYNSTSDLYTYFYELSYKLLNENGISTFISSNKWMRAKYGFKLRKFFKENTNINQIIDFGGYQVFEATVDTNIMIFQKSEKLPKFAKLRKFNVYQIKDDFEKTQDLTNYFANHKLQMNQNNLDINSFTFADEKVMNLKKKIEKIGTPLKDWDVNIKRGITTGFNEAFIIDNETKEELCRKDPKSAEILKPILKGRDINRYSYDWKGLWIINSHNGLREINLSRINVIKDYPVIYKYLSKFKDKLINRDDQGDHWTNLRNCAFLKEFEKEKIVWREIVQDSCFTWDSNKFYTLAKVYMMTGKESSKYLLAVLNTKIGEYALKTFYSPFLGKTVSEFKKEWVQLLPIPKISKTIQKLFIELVDQILLAKKAGKDTQKLEDQINLMVYKLYELTYEDVKIIDENVDKVLASFGLNKADFERMSVEELGKLEV
ncbi:MAG: Eco57I restriction-modification methylase domain-containing protein [Candidatus Cloacimonadales bacterium]|nr:Eco57I restriction-modification methylase domain-containing protein [Candidatus Cloacimonadales bacterium]